MSTERDRARTTGDDGGGPGSRWVSRWTLLVALALAGCDGEEPRPETPSPAQTPAPADAPASSAPAAPPSLLAGVIPQAIQPPPDGGSTYRVDAYVAALVAEQLRRSPAPFMAWRSDGTDPAQPSAGYRVGPLPPDDPFARLGLQEGDIVEAVNGISTAEPGWTDQALRRGENQVTVTLFRDDVSMTLAYRLMGGLAWQALVQPQSDLPQGDGGGDDGVAAADPLDVDPAAADDPGRGAGAGIGSGGGSRPSSSPSSSPSRPSVSGSGGSSGSGSRPPSGGGSSKAVARCTSQDRCTLDKTYFDRMIASPSMLQSQADVVPAIRNDVFSGYKLRTVRPGTAVAQLGFRSGDKITHVNGRDLTNDAEAMQLYLGLAGTRVFKVRYLRGGSARTKTITLD